MRFETLAIAFAALAGSDSILAETGFTWAADRPLSWADFEGRVPNSADSNRVAAANTAISWSYAMELRLARGECIYRIVTIESSAEFVPAGSWVRPGHETDDVLEHEQLHFDITKLHQLRFQQAAVDVVGADRACRGNSERSAKRFVERDIDDLIGSLYEAHWSAHLDDQAAYDSQTHHGIDREAQAAWTHRISAALSETIQGSLSRAD